MNKEFVEDSGDEGGVLEEGLEGLGVFLLRRSVPVFREAVIQLLHEKGNRKSA